MPPAEAKFPEKLECHEPSEMLQSNLHHILLAAEGEHRAQDELRCSQESSQDQVRHSVSLVRWLC